MSNDLITTDNSGSSSAGDGGGYADSARVVSSTGATGRKAEIQRIMNTDFDRYEREFHDEYRAILEAELQEANPDKILNAPTEPMRAETSRNALLETSEGKALVYDWESVGGFKTQLEHVQKDVGKIVRSLGDARAQKAFMERFDRSIAEPARFAIYRDIALGKPAWAPSASESEVKLFATTAAGAELVGEWGRFAAENVGMLRKRFARFVQTITDDEERDFWAWFEGQDARTAKTIFRGLL
jgi:hypothetical protein